MQPNNVRVSGFGQTISIRLNFGLGCQRSHSQASILRAPLFVLLLLSDPSAEAAAGFVGLGGLDDGSEVRIHRCARLVGLPAEAIQLCSVEPSVLSQSY
jgi:hypothetical protein